MRIVNNGTLHRGLTFPQWKALLEMSNVLSQVAKYLDDPLMLFRANALGLKVRARYYG